MGGEITIFLLQDSVMQKTQSAEAETERERGRLRQGEVSKDSNQRQNPLNLQLSGDSADILDPSSSLPLFHSDEGSVIVIPPKVLPTNPDDPFPYHPPPSCSSSSIPLSCT